MNTRLAPLRSFIRGKARGTIRAALRFALTRRLINMLYPMLSNSAHQTIHRRTRDLFRDRTSGIPNGSWNITFAGRRIALPLREPTSWLDWDQAVSVLGHEVPIKETYETLLTQAAKPDLFVDIGANYGTHSLLFLVCGVPVLTFEPNASCHDYFRAACALNGVTPRIEPVALGSQSGEAELVYPPQDTWFGSVNTDVSQRLMRDGNVERRTVPLRRLDEYVPAMAGKKVFMKIDVEGNELAILQGADSLLETVRPVIIFEAWRGENRAKIAKIFEGKRYRIASLPLRAGAAPAIKSPEGFAEATDDDFVAIPMELLEGSGRSDAATLFARPIGAVAERATAGK